MTGPWYFERHDENDSQETGWYLGDPNGPGEVLGPFPTRDEPDRIMESRARAAAIARGLSSAVGEQVARLIELGAFPDDWDGHEVRQLLADEMAREVTTLMRDVKSHNGARWRAYKRAAAEGISRRHEVRP